MSSSSIGTIPQRIAVAIDRRLYVAAAAWVSVLILVWVAGCGRLSDSREPNVLDIEWQGDRFLWIVTTSEVIRWDATNEEATSFKRKANEILFVSPTGLVCVRESRMPLCYVGTTWNSLNMTQGLAASNLFSAIQSTDESVWLGSSALLKCGSVTQRCVAVVSELAPTSSADGFETRSEGFYSLMEAKDRSIWAGTSQGIIRLRGVDIVGWWKKNDGLSSNIVLNVLEGHDGTIWARTDFGLDYWDGDRWKSLSDFDPGLDTDGRVNSLLVQDANEEIWVGISNGVAKWDGAEWQKWTDENGLPSWRVNALLAARDGAIWVATDKGVSMWDGSTWSLFTVADGLRSDDVRTLAEDTTGNVWAGSSKGMNYFDATQHVWKSIDLGK